MTRKNSLFALAAVGTVGVVLALSTARASGEPAQRGDVVVFVTGQGLYFDSIVNGPLPPRGPFQLLETEGPSGFQTEFGPGDEEYVGGRWWLDDGDGMMGPEDLYFSCPLLGVGRDSQ